jgi:hypothetical protein
MAVRAGDRVVGRKALVVIQSAPQRDRIGGGRIVDGNGNGWKAERNLNRDGFADRFHENSGDFWLFAAGKYEE